MSSISISADHHGKNNTLVPTGRLVLNPEFCDGNVALGILGEAGRDNARANGTIGFALSPCQKVKFGGEYLSQKLKFGFRDGHTKRWVQQWAVGGKYLAIFDECFIEGVTVDIYYSRAESHHLRSHELSVTELLKRRIAGSHAAGLETGILVKPWCGALLTLLADYDNVKFKRRFESNHNLTGFGWTAILNQKLFNDFDLNLKAEMRRPFNNYTAELLYANSCCYGFYSIGLFGGYTHGKSHLPNVTTAGIELGLSFGGKSSNSCLNTCESCCSNVPCRSALANWVLEPAVYMPIVLAVRDERVVNTCTAPQLVTELPLRRIPPSPNSFDATPYFSGTNLVWSIVSDSPANITASITSAGIVTLNYAGGLDGSANITITATNECGTAQGTFFAAFELF